MLVVFPRLCVCCAFAIGLLLVGEVLPAGSWPTWRGPNRDAISPEKGLLDSWTDEGPPLKWQAKGLGKGYSSVSIVGGRIYTIGATGTPAGGYQAPAAKKGRGRGRARSGRGVGSKGDCSIIALDAATGKKSGQHRWPSATRIAHRRSTATAFMAWGATAS